MKMTPKDSPERKELAVALICAFNDFAPKAAEHLGADKHISLFRISTDQLPEALKDNAALRSAMAEITSYRPSLRPQAGKKEALRSKHGIIGGEHPFSVWEKDGIVTLRTKGKYTELPVDGIIKKLGETPEYLSQTR